MIVAIVHITDKWEIHKFNSASTLMNWWEAVDKSTGVFHTVNCTTPTQPPVHVKNDVHRFGQRWCPWCGKGRIFEPCLSLGVNRCIVCHVSDSEYHVRRMNGEN